VTNAADRVAGLLFAFQASFAAKFIEGRLVASCPVAILRNVEFLVLVIFYSGTVLIAPAVTLSIDATRVHRDRIPSQAVDATLVGQNFKLRNAHMRNLSLLVVGLSLIANQAAPLREAPSDRTGDISLYRTRELAQVYQSFTGLNEQAWGLRNVHSGGSLVILIRTQLSPSQRVRPNAANCGLA